MGVQISEIIPKKEIGIGFLSGKEIAIDAYNIFFQFLSTIRRRDTGEPLKDSKGRITSHLTVIFYRSIKLVEKGLKPIYVIDGEPPKWKKRVLRERKATREEAREKWKEAVEKGEKDKIMRYAQNASKVTKEMADEARKLLESMGIPCLQAPSEGEAQAALLVKNGDAYAVGSQDFDSLLFGSERTVRNLSITGKRKLPGKQKWVEINPEIIELDKVLSELDITREQLVMLGILIGTDYNDGGIKGIGPKTGLKLVREKKTLEKIFEDLEWNFEPEPKELFDFFMNPPLKQDYKLDWGEPEREKVMEIMVDEHDFSENRIRNGIKRLLKAHRNGTQFTLNKWTS